VKVESRRSLELWTQRCARNWKGRSLAEAENRMSGSEGGSREFNRPSLPLSAIPKSSSSKRGRTEWH
jgi:hypothetical protein